MGQAACVDPGGGHQQRETQLLSDAKSTIGKFLQASPHAKMHVQVQRFAGQLHFCQKKKKNQFILVMNFKPKQRCHWGSSFLLLSIFCTALYKHVLYVYIEMNVDCIFSFCCCSNLTAAACNCITFDFKHVSINNLAFHSANYPILHLCHMLLDSCDIF